MDSQIYFSYNFIYTINKCIAEYLKFEKSMITKNANKWRHIENMMK